VGIDSERLEMFNLSAAMGPRWAEICRTFTDKIRNLGPSPVRMALIRKKERQTAETAKGAMTP